MTTTPGNLNMHHTEANSSFQQQNCYGCRAENGCWMSQMLHGDDSSIIYLLIITDCDVKQQVLLRVIVLIRLSL